MIDGTALLTGLLQHYSPTGQESGAVAYLVDCMQALGYRARIDPAGNAVGVIGEGPDEILCLGHIDTVPGNILVHRQGDVLHGRGAVDAKGPLACFVLAGAQAILHPGWRITVIGAVGEEGDSRGARYLRDTHPAPNMVIIGEPSGWERLTLGYKGSLWLRYSVRQPLAHTASQEGNACETAVHVWMSILSLAEQYNLPGQSAFHQLTPTLREMSSDEDGFYQSASLHIGLRLPPSLEPASLLQQITALAGDAELAIEDCIPAYRSEKNSPLVRAFLAAIRSSGGNPGFTLKTGTSDMNLVGPAWNCPILAYGPGDSSLDHTPQEQISLSEYEKGITVLRQALENVMQSSPTSNPKQGKKAKKPDARLVGRADLLIEQGVD